MMRDDAALVRITNGLALVVALVVAIVPPLALYGFDKRYLVGRMDAETQLQAQTIGQMISRNPRFWPYETERLEAVLAKHSFADGDDGTHRLFDAGGDLIASHPPPSAPPPPWPVVSRTVPVYDGERLVARIEAQHSLRQAMLTTLVVAAVSILLSGGVFAVFRTLPMRALRRAIDRASFLASHDALTGLPNRVLFRDRLEQAAAQVARRNDFAAILCLDLDHFKDVNDTLGHGAGDLLLKKVTERLRGCLRDADTLARLGGDEFAIIQTGLGQPEAAAILSQRLIELIAQPFSLDGNDVIVGASIGIALVAANGITDPDQLLRNADLALYRAKDDGRGAYRFFEDEMNVRLHARKRLEQELRQGLEKGHFELHYQPQVALDSGRIIGVEALVRWRHPLRGLVSPLDFIPVAEDTGLIVPLGAWVLRSACAAARAWDDIKVAVNLSPVQFRQPGLAELVADVLAATGLPGERLELEITEGLLLHDSDAALATLNALKALGVRIAMDDFGTGYSSLSYLRKFPFDTIKIDRSFVRDLGVVDGSAAIVRAVVALSHSLGMRVNAEGVETSDQARMLAGEGCEEVQGFFFGRPMPAAELAAMLAVAAGRSAAE